MPFLSPECLVSGAPLAYVVSSCILEKNTPYSGRTQPCTRKSREPGGFQHSPAARVRCPCMCTLGWDPQDLTHSLSRSLWESCCPLSDSSDPSQQSWSEGRQGQQRTKWLRRPRSYLSHFCPSPSPRVSARCPRSNAEVEWTPQRLQCPMDTDPPQEIRRRFGKKYACSSC